MSNQPNEAAIYALSLLHLGTIDWLPVPGTHRLNGHAARVVLAAIRDGKVPGVEMSHPDQVCSARILNERIASLRSALANAEKQIEEHERWRTQHGAAYQQVADARDAALAKLAEAEKDAAEWKESSRAWQEQASVIHLERDRLECDALRNLAPQLLEAVEKARIYRKTMDEYREAVDSKTPMRAIPFVAAVAEAEKELNEALAALGGKGGGG